MARVASRKGRNGQKAVTPKLAIQQAKQEIETTEQLINEFVPGPERWKDMLSRPPFYVNRLKPMTSIDRVTRRWLRNANDERAAQEGYRFDEQRGQFVVNWISNNCYLYEGDKAGLLMDIDDWQYEFLMQTFGWVYHSEDYGRWIRRFTEVNCWIPKKNAKSPTLAATGLYLLCGDGEYGQKCYTIARDSKQGLISHTHAKEMVKYSESLTQECKISETTHMITHLPTNSRYILVSGENNKSTEGFNGSLFVDEVHVVDFELMKRVKRAKISRSEPLHMEVSTAGDNAENYGGSRARLCDKIKAYGDSSANVDGIYKPNHLVLDFSMDQTLALETLYDEKRVMEMGIQCNPTIGRILRLAEFKGDWQESVGSMTQLAEFAMYRLNKWMAAGANWIGYKDWLACGKQYKLSDLKDYPCFAGLDLSKTRDMTALTLVFAVPDEEHGILPHLVPFFWLPEETVKLYKAHVDFKAPEFARHIKFCAGKVIDYELVAQRMNWVYENFDLRAVGYDPAFSGTLMDILLNDFGWPDEDFLFKFRQTMNMIGPPTDDMERLVLSGELVHNNNHVLNWQMGHCAVQFDKNGSKKPIKPELTDFRKIDGVMSSIMGLGVMLQDNEVMSALQEHNSILLYPEGASKKTKDYGDDD